METIKAKPTTYKGVRFRSKSEARFAVLLDANRWHWRYEPKHYKSGDWLPDFAVTVPVEWEPLVILVECKPCAVSDEYAKWIDREFQKTLASPTANHCCCLVETDWYGEENRPSASMCAAKAGPHKRIIEALVFRTLYDARGVENAKNYRFDLKDGGR